MSNANPVISGTLREMISYVFIHMYDLLASFDEYFQVVPANSQELREEVFRLRYKVYCEEIKVAGPEVCKALEGLEYDAYDVRSNHCILRHRPSGKTVGVVRLVLADADDPNRPFPVEIVAGDQFDSKRFDPDSLPRLHTAEISRLILAKDFRKRKGEYVSAVGNDQNIRKPVENRPYFPHPVLGLFVAIMRLSADERVSHLYAAMEPVLNRLLRRFGLDFLPIGSTVHYFGLRQPFLGVIESMASRLKRQHRDVWKLVTDGGRLLSGPNN